MEVKNQQVKINQNTLYFDRIYPILRLREEIDYECLLQLPDNFPCHIFLNYQFI